MSQASCGGSDRRRAARLNAIALRAADWLPLAAAPTFAVMALLAAIVADDPAEMLCSPAHMSPLSGMATMYLLMSVFHVCPWLKLVRTKARQPD